jgi:hypothetical protein
MTVRTAKKGLDVHRQEEKASEVTNIIPPLAPRSPLPRFVSAFSALTHAAESRRDAPHPVRRPGEPAGGVQRAVGRDPQGKQGSLVRPLLAVLPVVIYHYHRSVQGRRGEIRHRRCLRQRRLLVLVGAPLPNFRRRVGVPVHQDTPHSHAEGALELPVPGARPSLRPPEQC